MIYTIEKLKVDSSTPYHETYGQRYWIKFRELDTPYQLSFKKEPTVGQQIDGSVEGTKFKKAYKPFGGQTSLQTDLQPLLQGLDRIEKKIDQLLGNDVQLDRSIPQTDDVFSEADVPDFEGL